jgi:hypothetical protein
MMEWNDRSRIRAVNTALAAGGMIVWFVLAAVTGKVEPWDTDQFWSYGLVAMLLLNAAASFLDPQDVLLKGIISVSLQPVAMMLLAGEVGSMMPLGLFVFGLLGLFYSIGGFIGWFIKTKYFHSMD